VRVLTQPGEQLVERLLVADLLQTDDVDVVVEHGRNDVVQLGPNGWRELAGGEQVLDVPTRNRDHVHPSAGVTIQPAVTAVRMLVLVMRSAPSSMAQLRATSSQSA
jgi:hypothetical protein